MTEDGKRYMQFVRADYYADDVEVIAEVMPEFFDARKMRVSDGSGKLYVRNSAQEMLGFKVDGNDAVGEVDQLYGIIRRGVEYPVNDVHVSRAIDAMERPSNSLIEYIAPRGNYNWHVHGYRGVSTPGSAVKYHMSLNVDVDDELIRKLDAILAKDQGQSIVNFKIPPKGNRWKTMSDPISIYLRETNPQLEREIAEAARSHVRTTSDVGLLGRKIEDGVAIAYETSGGRKDIVQNIINQVARKDPGVAESLRITVDPATGKAYQTAYSVGNTEALRLWASDFLGYTIPAVVP